MVSDKQIEANRRNAQKSTGPRTAEGKRKVAMNALTYGLTGATVVLPTENQAEYDDLLMAIIAEIRPQGALEYKLATNLVDNLWRIDRAKNSQADVEANAQYRDERQNELNKIQWYADRLERSSLRLLKELRQTARDRETGRLTPLPDELILHACIHPEGLDTSDLPGPNAAYRPTRREAREAFQISTAKSIMREEGITDRLKKQYAPHILKQADIELSLEEPRVWPERALNRSERLTVEGPEALPVYPANSLPMQAPQSNSALTVNPAPEADPVTGSFPAYSVQHAPAEMGLFSQNEIHAAPCHPLPPGQAGRHGP